MLKFIIAALGPIAEALAIVAPALKAAGVDIGPIGAEAVKIIGATAADITNFQNGQAVVIGNFSEQGKAGVLIAVAVDGPAYKSIFGG